MRKIRITRRLKSRIGRGVARKRGLMRLDASCFPPPPLALPIFAKERFLFFSMYAVQTGPRFLESRSREERYKGTRRSVGVAPLGRCSRWISPDPDPRRYSHESVYVVRKIVSYESYVDGRQPMRPLLFPDLPSSSLPFSLFTLSAPKSPLFVRLSISASSSAQSQQKLTSSSSTTVSSRRGKSFCWTGSMITTSFSSSKTACRARGSLTMR